MHAVFLRQVERISLYGIGVALHDPWLEWLHDSTLVQVDGRTYGLGHASVSAPSMFRSCANRGDHSMIGK